MNRSTAAFACAALFALGGTAFADGTNTIPASAIVAQARLAARPLKLAAVDQVIEQSDRAVQSCRRGRLGVDTRAVLLRLDIDGDGKVMSVAPTVEREGAKLTAEERCLERVVSRLQFPASGAVTHLEYPFMFVPNAR